MPCFHPLQAYRARYVNDSGKRPLVFKRSEGIPNSDLQVACGQCIGCRLEYSRQWAVRCYHEAQLHLDNSFITLTYDDAHLPFGGTLVSDELSRFFKRLRKQIPTCKILHFSCGEYGDETGRPHYHSCIFGYAFPDRIKWKTERGIDYFRSPLLEKCWTLGQSVITDFTFKTAAYVARYMVKKIKGTDAESHYERVDLDTGEIFSLLPEFSRMSLRPAVGKEWWEQFGQSVKDWDTVVIDGKEIPPPKYYDVLHAQSDPERVEARKRERVQRARRSPDNTPSRLATREKSQTLRLKELRRQL